MGDERKCRHEEQLVDDEEDVVVVLLDGLPADRLQLHPDAGGDPDTDQCPATAQKTRRLSRHVHRPAWLHEEI